MGRADLKERSRWQKRIAADPDFALDTAVLRTAIFSWTASPRPRAFFNELSERKLENPKSSGDAIQHRGVEG